jgi:hypothetical protein
MKKIKIKIEEGCGCVDSAPMTIGISKSNAHEESARMHRTSLAHLISDSQQLLDIIQDADDLPEWVESKITKASDYMNSVLRYIKGDEAHDSGALEEKNLK